MGDGMGCGSSKLELALRMALVQRACAPSGSGKLVLKKIWFRRLLLESPSPKLSPETVLSFVGSDSFDVFLEPSKHLTTSN